MFSLDGVLRVDNLLRDSVQSGNTGTSDFVSDLTDQYSSSDPLMLPPHSLAEPKLLD